MDGVSSLMMKMKSQLKSIFLAGFRLIRIDAFVRKPGYHYVPDYFGKATHKQQDIRNLPVFGELATEVIGDKRSSLYYDRLLTIYQIVARLSSFVTAGQAINLAEVGVYKGGTSYFIAALADRLKMQISHYCFDTFEGHAAEDINDEVEVSHKPGSFADTSYESVKEYLGQFKNVNIYKGRFQDICHHVQDAPMHFVHLDMDIYEPTIFSLYFFGDRLVKGGVILLDDYGFASCPGIEKAIKEFTDANSQYFGMPLLSGQYMLVKL